MSEPAKLELKDQERLLTKHFGELGALAYSVDDSGRSVRVVGVRTPGRVSERAITQMFEHFTRYNPLIAVSGGRAAEDRKFQWDGKDFIAKSEPA